VDVVEDKTNGTTNVCTEIWTLNTPYTACVGWTAVLARPLDTDSKDTVADFKLQYRAYTFNAFAGTNVNAAAPDFFGSKSVDFATFNLPSNALGASALIASASIGCLAALSILY